MSLSLSRRLLLATPAGVIALSGAPAAASIADNTALPLWRGDYWAMKERGSEKIWLAMYRKRPGAPHPGEQPLPVLFLVHGSSNSALPSFDLTVHQQGDYSLMDALAQRGFDVWTMDDEGYGRSSRSSGNSDIASGVEDLKAAVDVIARETGQSRLHFFGESSGALRAAAFAMARPERVDRLVLEAFTYTGKGSPTLAKRAGALDFYRTHNRPPRGRDMIRSIFTRDKSGTSDPAVAEALADAELVYGETVPTGTYLDMTANLPLVDPEKVLCPVQLVRGEYDGIATLDDLMDFYQKLPNGDRQLVTIPGAAHAVSLSLNRQMLWHVMAGFLTMPPRVNA
ncbi:MAG: alpha/beta fold hydrolase [Acetobacteraceae bacterium]|nr:alpha/beta fold hydrolase [Acetobacteraceae bacterium]